MPWQPRVIRDSTWALDVTPEPAWRSQVARVVRVVSRQRGYILRTAIRSLFALAALLTMPITLSLVVVAVMAATQFLCDEPVPPENPRRPPLKSVP